MMQPNSISLILVEYMNREEETHLGDKFYDRMVEKGINLSYSHMGCLCARNSRSKEMLKGAEKLMSILQKVGHVNTSLALIVEERMAKDNVEMDEETKELIRLTSLMPAR
ncbi:hypothetical protein HID58_064599 [Brassica napus]|uniref:Pentatricopeptide repeat-containing protein n=1 Tax=Brassica napus TaxID=3708 RepID=A0ABQ7ZAG0_BRANA|nr:hypothetical protein HID58_064599 [Brassica napus]